MSNPIDQQLEELDKRLTMIEKKLNSIACAEKLSSQELKPDSLSQSLSQSSNTYPSPLNSPNHVSSNLMSKWLKDYWMVAIGIFFVLLATGWFLKYAFLNIWIHPAIRVLATLIASGITYGGGVYWIHRKPQGGKALVILGAVGGLLSLYMAQSWYGLIIPIMAFLGITLIILGTAYLSIRLNLADLALATITSALYVPNLIGFYSSTLLLLYLLVLSLGTLYMFLSKRFSGAYLLAWMGILKYLFTYWPLYQPFQLYACCLLLFAIYFIPSAFAVCRDQRRELVVPTIILTSSLFVIPIWAFLTFDADLPTLFFVVTLLLYSGALYILLPNIRSTIQVYVSLLYGLCLTGYLFTLTHKFLFNYEHILMIVVGVEALIGVWIGACILKNLGVAKFSTFYFLLPLFILSPPVFPEHVVQAWLGQVKNLEFKFLVWLIEAVTIALSYRLLQTFKGQNSNRLKNFNHYLLGVFLIYFALLIWTLPNLVALYIPIPSWLITLLTLLIGDLLFYQSLIKESKKIRTFALSILILVIVRLLKLDEWNLTIMERMITFLLAGFLLIAIAFMDYGKNRKNGKIKINDSAKENSL